MASPAAVLQVLLTANTAQFNAAMARADAQMKATAATAATSATAATDAYKRAGTRMNAVGKTLTRTMTLPALAVGAASVKMALDFEHSMSLIQTQAGASAQEVKMLTKQVEEFAASGKSTHGPNDLSKALFHIESAGYRGAKAMEVLKSSEALATTGGADMEQTTNALVGAMKTGIKGTESLAGTIGTLNAIVGAGNMRMDDLTAAMGTGFLSNAKQMGVTIQQAGAALATLTRQGQPATQGATRLSMAFRMLMSPTDKAKSALESIGLTAEKLGTMMQAGHFPAAIHLLVQHLDSLGNSPEALQKKATVIRDMFGARSATGINTIIQGLHDYDSTLAQVNAKSADFNKLHGAAMQTPANRLRAIWAQLQVTLIKLGETLLPTVLAMAKSFQTLASAVGKLPPWLVEGIFMGALVLGPTIRLVALITKLAAAWRAVAAAQAGATVVGAGAGGGAAAAGAGGLLAGATGAALLGGAAVGAAVLGGREAGRTQHQDVLINKAGQQQLQIQGALAAELERIRAHHVAITVAQAEELKKAAQILVQHKQISEETRHQVDVIAEQAAAGGRTLSQGLAGIFDPETWARTIKAHKGNVGAAMRDLINYCIDQAKNLTPAMREQVQSAAKAVTGTLVTLKGVAGQHIKGLSDVIQGQMARANAAIRSGKNPLEVLAGTYKNTTKTIERAMNANLISVKTGTRLINQLLIAQMQMLGLQGKPQLSALPSLGSGPGQVNLIKPQKPGKAQGGSIVPGAGSGDKVLMQAMVEPNEGVFVMNRNAMGAMQAINNQFPRRAKGGKLGGLKWHGTGSGVLDDISAAVLNKEADAARAFLGRMKPKAGIGGAGGTSAMDGHPVATWIYQILTRARKQGAHFSVTSGYRSTAEQAAIYASGVRPAARPGTSHHEGTSYPSGAVDVSGAASLAAWLAGKGSRFNHGRLVYAGAQDPVHFSHPYGGGYQKGGKISAHSPSSPAVGNQWLHANTSPGGRVGPNEIFTMVRQLGGSKGDAAFLSSVAFGESGYKNIAQRGGLGRGVVQVDIGQNPQYAKWNLLNPWEDLVAGIALHHSGAAWYGKRGPAGHLLVDAIRGAAGTNGATSKAGKTAADPFAGITGKMLVRLHQELLPQALGKLKDNMQAANAAMKAAKKTHTVQDDIAATQQIAAATSSKQGFMKTLKAWRKKKDPVGARSALTALVQAEQALTAAAEDAETDTSALDAYNAMIQARNDIIGEQNLLALQGWQVGASQNPLLGIAGPKFPTQQLLSPQVSALPSMAASTTTASAIAKKHKKPKIKIPKRLKGKGPIAHYALGGVVPGPVGSPQMAVVHGGETIIPPSNHHTAVHVYIDGQELKKGVRKETRSQSKRGHRPLPSSRRN